MSLIPGMRLGPYEIRAPLGSGGMGKVFRASDVRLDREVAVKVLPDDVAGDQKALARFEAEAKAVAALSHPNILTLYDVGAESGVRFVVTELLEGQTLRLLLTGGALAPKRVLDAASSIARGPVRGLALGLPAARGTPQAEPRDAASRASPSRTPSTCLVVVRGFMTVTRRTLFPSRSVVVIQPSPRRLNSSRMRRFRVSRLSASTREPSPLQRKQRMFDSGSLKASKS